VPAPPLVIQSGPSLSGAIGLLTSAGLPVSDVTTAHLANFFYCGASGSPDGLVGLEFCGSNALLRSLAVVPGLRSSGLGTALVVHAESRARAQGIQSLFVLTTTAESFFLSRGYAPVERHSAPAEIRSTREFAEICPASSAFMVKRLVP
jgi:amino-acid N-acetyltransferase